jgi:enamine deaminase RidA (YjgF/YER057c/UK114 family)
MDDTWRRSYGWRMQAVLAPADGGTGPGGAGLVKCCRARGTPEARLKALGIELPPAPKPLASYVPAVRTGNLVYLAGQGPLAGGRPTVTGKVGAELTEEEGYKAARATILTSLAALRAEIGSLRHARSAVGANDLPLNIPVEIEMIVEVAPGSAAR